MKRTLITLMALGGAVMAQDTEWTALTLNGGSGNVANNTNITTVDGITSITTGQASVNWTEEINYLTTWKTTFTLTDTTVANADIWSSNNSGNDPRGMVLGIREDGSLRLGGKKADATQYAITSAGVVKANTPVVITLSFEAIVATAEYTFYNPTIAAGTIVGGTYSLTVGEETVSYTLTSAQALAENGVNAKFYDNTGTRYITNGGAETFTNIQVWKGTDTLIPEPATATLSLLALAGLAVRRRRR